MRNIDASPDHLRLFAKGPLEVASTAHAALPLHVQNPPVPHLSWEKADEIIKMVSFPQKSECGRRYPTFIGTTQQRIGCGKIVMPPKTLTKHEDQLCSNGGIEVLL